MDDLFQETQRVLNAARKAYMAWWEWVPANDRLGESFEKEMRTLGDALQKLGVSVPEPYLEDEEEGGDE